MRDNLHVIVMSAEHGFFLWLNNTDLKGSGKQIPQETAWTRNKEVGCLKVLRSQKFVFCVRDALLLVKWSLQGTANVAL